MRAVALFLLARREEWLRALSAALVGSVGFLAGIVAMCALETTEHPPESVHASGATVASLTLEGFRDGALRGRVVGPVRLYVQDDVQVVADDGTFALMHPAFRIDQVTIVVPPGMRFVASKNGKKYYPVASSAGERIVPENRRYFVDEAAAEAAGFTR